MTIKSVEVFLRPNSLKKFGRHPGSDAPFAWDWIGIAGEPGKYGGRVYLSCEQIDYVDSKPEGFFKIEWSSEDPRSQALSIEFIRPSQLHHGAFQ